MRNLAILYSLFLLTFTTIIPCKSQENSKIQIEIIIDSCKRAIDKKDINSIKNHLSILSSLDGQTNYQTWEKRIPNLYMEAARVMSLHQNKKEAIEYYLEASRLFEEISGPTNQYVPLALIEIADMLFDLREFTNAIPYYLSANSPKYKSSSRLNVYCLNKIGICYNNLEEYENARDCFKEIEDYYTFLNVDSASIGLNYINLATTYEGEKNYSEALISYNHSLGFFDSTKQDQNLDISFIYNGIGNVHLDKKEYRIALTYYNKSLQIRKKTLKPQSIEISQNYYNLGYCYFQLGNTLEAISYCDSSINSNIRNVNVLESIENITKIDCLSREDLLICFLDKAEYLQQLINESTASTGRFEEEALKALRIAEKLFYETYSEISSNRSKIMWSRHNERLFKLFILHYAKQGRISDTLEFLSYCDMKRNFNHKNFESNNETYGKYGRLTPNLLTQKLENLEPNDNLTNRNAIDIIKHLPVDTVSQGLVTNHLNNNDLWAIQDKLQKSTSVVAYAICDSLLFTKVIRHDTVAIRLKVATELRKGVANHLKQIKTYASQFDFAKEIYQILWQDIRSIIKDSECVIVIPDEYLFNLPFETLVSSESNHYLIEANDVSYAFSLGSLLKPNKQIDSLTRFYGFSPVGRKSAEQFPLENLSGMNYLDMADHEIESCSKIINLLNETAKNYYSRNATITALQRIDHKDNVIHISTHSVIDKRNPWNSYLQLYPDTIYSLGKLYFSMIYALNVRSNLIVLNACSTGVGGNYSIEGPLSLARAFSSNQVKNLIFSLWKIEDQIAFNFIEQFYENLRKEKSISESLNSTKRLFLASSYNHPFFWAGHVHYFNSL